MRDEERWVRRRDALWRRVLDDVVILTATEPEPFALSGGARLWELLDEPRRALELGAPTDLLESLCQRGAVERHP